MAQISDSYGAWISPSGKIENVNGSDGHPVVAKNIILQNEVFKEIMIKYKQYDYYKYITDQDKLKALPKDPFTTMLLELNWVRLLNIKNNILSFEFYKILSQDQKNILYKIINIQDPHFIFVDITFESVHKIFHKRNALTYLLPHSNAETIYVSPLSQFRD